MAQGWQVLEMLRPAGGWVITADDFDSITWEQGTQPVTKKEFQDGFAAFDSWKAAQDQEKQNAKNALLAKLGISAEEAALLLS
jgi:hypothetical protein